MDQRVYYGDLSPAGLADYLVSIFQPAPFHAYSQRTRAQKIVQGERVYVQIMRDSDWGAGSRRALGVDIARIPGGIRVEMGASDWLDIDEAGLAGVILGALFFPPLLLLPLLQGLSGSNFAHDVWNTIESYCVQASGGQTAHRRAPQGFYCTYCGAFNHPGASHCHACHAPFDESTPAQPTSQSTASEPVAVAPEPEAQTGTPQKKGDTRPMFALMICPNCKATVVPAHFCGNCAAPLPDVGAEESSGA